jgi:hypothetical protein
MICECKKLKKGPFKTEEIYLDFEKKMNQLVDKSVLQKVGEDDCTNSFFFLMNTVA